MIHEYIYIYMCDSCHTYEGVVLHTWYATSHMNQSCCLFQYVAYMSYTHLSERQRCIRAGVIARQRRGCGALQNVQTGCSFMPQFFFYCATWQWQRLTWLLHLWRGSDVVVSKMCKQVVHTYIFLSPYRTYTGRPVLTLLYRSQSVSHVYRSCISVTWLGYMCNVTHSCVQMTDLYAWLHSCMCAEDLCDVTHLYVWHDSSIWLTRFIHMRDFTYLCVQRIRVMWLIHMCDMTHSYVWHDVVHSYVWHDSRMSVTWLIHVCNLVHSCVWHDSFIFEI